MTLDKVIEYLSNLYGVCCSLRVEMDELSDGDEYDRKYGEFLIICESLRCIIYYIRENFDISGDETLVITMNSLEDMLGKYGTL